MIALAVAGFLISVLLKLAKKRKEFKNKFKFKIWWEENKYQAGASVLSIGVMLYFAPLFAPAMIGTDIPQNSYFYDLFAMCAGYSNYALFHDIMKAYNPKTNE